MFPSLVVKNQQGEQSNFEIIDGSSQIWCNFVVDSTNGNGLGIRSLKTNASLANFVKNVYMHTSATPASGNPNPASGLILVELGKAYANYINGSAGFVSPLSGSNVNISSGLSVGVAYTIVSVGSSTAANWQAIGLPSNIAPAVGVSFIATSASAGVGSGIVQVLASAASGISHIEVVGDPNQSCNVSSGGAQIICACYGAGAGALTMDSYTPAGTNDSSTPPIFTGTPAVLTGSVTAGSNALVAPANGTVIGLTFNMVLNPGSPL